MARKPSKKSQVARADRLFSQIVRRQGFCTDCGKTSDLQCAHGFSRRYRNTRWDFQNAWCLCKGCHLKYTMRPLEWDEFMLGALGSEGYRRLRARALDTSTKIDVAAVLEGLEAA